MGIEKVGMGDFAAASLIKRPTLIQSAHFGGIFEVTCFDPNGKLKWKDQIENLVVNVGLTDILEQYFNGSTYTASHMVGLTDGTPTEAAGDTMASHAGWVEVTAYDEANRPAYNPAAAASQSITNSASVAVFTISADTTTIGGAFITDNNTKGGSTGTLVSAGAFTAGDKLADDNDTLNVTYTFNATSS